jgi:hypothetical protein
MKRGRPVRTALLYNGLYDGGFKYRPLAAA